MFTKTKIATFLALVCLFAFGCTAGSPVSFDTCKTDEDCTEGNYCKDGLCVPDKYNNKVDGDLDKVEGEGEQSIENEIDFDMEDWNSKCPKSPEYPTAFVQCKTYSCDMVAPPVCWSCDWVADPDQAGNSCELEQLYGGGGQGVCNKSGECVPIATDGDGETIPDGDDIDVEGFNQCMTIGGTCNDYSASCPKGYRPTAYNYGCGTGVCCVPLDQVECYKSNGYCAPAGDASINFCGDGYTAAKTALGCEMFGSVVTEWCCVKEQPPCVEEGGRKNTIDSDLTNDQCCPGLTEVSNAIPTGTGSADSCIATPDGSSYCVKCGDGICGAGENYCRCPKDCAKPGECKSDKECPPQECTDTSGGLLMCVENKYFCDMKDNTCKSKQEYHKEMMCDHNSGKCEQAPNSLCESEGNGICKEPHMSYCPSGYDLNKEPLGCAEPNVPGGGPCCLKAKCLDNNGYCTTWQNGCEKGYKGVGGPDTDCPGGRSALCCQPETPVCTPLGGEINGSEGQCCAGLTKVDRAELDPTTGACMYLDCECYVCLVTGDNYCDEMNGENKCNSKDCEDIPECKDNGDCKDSHCQGFSGLPNCLLHTYNCINGACEPKETIIENAYCDEKTNKCTPFAETACENKLNGYCTIQSDECDKGYVKNDHSAGCPGGFSGKCCVPDSNPCLKLGEVGYYAGAEKPLKCCDGLSDAQVAKVSADGTCEYPNCACFICLDQSDNICDGAAGENFCNSDACSPPPECQSDYDCKPDWCDATSSLPECKLHTYQCIYGTCREQVKTVKNSYCDMDTQTCQPFTEIECEKQNGYCTYYYNGCKDGYTSSQDPNQLDCPGGKSALCCLPDTNPCTKLGEMGYYHENDYCCGKLKDVIPATPTSNGECVAPPCNCFICLNPDDNYCDQKHGENYCNSDDCPKPTDCNTDKDCLDEQWNIYCMGHWDCTDSGECKAQCGGSCGNNKCEPELGESKTSCSTDCQTTIQCYQDKDCLDQDWTIKCTGHWDCNGNICQPKCGLPCGNQKCEPELGENESSCYQDCSNYTECQSSRDCINKDWNVDCYGYWDCENGLCQENCGYPCGNDYCEPYNGESASSCPNDCGGDRCRSNDDCSECYNDSSTTSCVQISGQCEKDGYCHDESKVVLANALCSNVTNKCQPLDTCERNGGICAYGGQCPPEYEPNSDLDCAGSDPNQTICCLKKEEPQCKNDYDCGETFCKQNGPYCYTDQSFCSYGTCAYASETEYGKICRETVTPYGEITMGCSTCLKGETINYQCENGIEVPWCECDGKSLKCITSPETQCYNVKTCREQRGYCTDYYDDCYPGFSEIHADCGNQTCAGGCKCCAFNLY